MAQTTRSTVLTAMRHVQLVMSIGLRREYSPLWPVPLPPPLPRYAGKPTLVLDIDETLVHTFSMRMETPDTVSFSFYTRPHLREFLEEVMTLYEVVFWTAGTASYCSAIVDAIETQVLQLPPTLYNVEVLRLPIKQKEDSSLKQVNFYALSRTQTLEIKNYMKYLPMLGRPMHRTIIIDDNVRSFPLHPRNGIKIEPFLPDVHLLQQSSHIPSIAAVGKEKKTSPGMLSAKEMEKVTAEIKRLEEDRSLLNLLPVLRAAAKTEDVTRELDHWRDSEYVRCDDFRETMNTYSVVRQQLLGSVLSTRRDKPIPQLQAHVSNAEFLSEANTAMQDHMLKSMRSQL